MRDRPPYDDRLPSGSLFEDSQAEGGPSPEPNAASSSAPGSERGTEPASGRRGRGGPRGLDATQRAIGLLTRREHSRKELQRKLTSRGMDAGEVETAIDKLAGLGWQDDARFADSLVRSRANNGYGPLRIRAELGTHGLGSDAVARAMAAYDGDWLANARDLVRRRFGQALSQDPVLRRKAADFLLRRGYDGDSIRNATRFDPDD